MRLTHYTGWGYNKRMSSFQDYLQHGNAWLFIPAAILLGALHGLEPGHSKTMMAAFIVAIRGTIGQAVLLGLSAAISHSLIIWVLAATALHYGSQWNAETVEPYLQLASAAMILGLAAWMFWRTRREFARLGHITTTTTRTANCSRSILATANWN